MIFTQKVVDATQVKFAALLEKAGEVKKQEILACLEEAKKTVSEDVIFAIQWIYANSPLSDMANYEFDMFKECAEHSVMLRETSPFAKAL